MHDIERKPMQEGSTSPPELKGAPTPEKPRQPRVRRSPLLGGLVLLIVALVIAGFLVLTSQKGKQPPHTVPKSTTVVSTVPATTARESTLPAPAATPIPAVILSGNNVNVTVSNGVIYLSTHNNTVYALRSGTGSLLWSHKIDGSADQPALVTNGIVYVVSYVGLDGPAYVYALHASDGKFLWRYENTSYSYLSLSTTNNNLIYVASPDGIAALQANNGTMLWHYATKGNTSSTGPLEKNGIVYFSSSLDNGSGALYALRASNGTPIWQYTSTGSISTSTVVNDTVYIVSGNGNLAALRTSDGHQLWKQTFDANIIQEPQLVNGVLYTSMIKIVAPTAANTSSPQQAIAAIDSFIWTRFQSVPAVQAVPHKQGLSSIYAIRATDGTTLWHDTINHSGNSWASWLLVKSGVVYASAANTEGMTGSGDLYAFQSSTGLALWHDKLKATPSGVLLANNVIYLATSSNAGTGAVYAVNPSNGSLLWGYPIAGSMFAPPVLDGTILYVGATNGMVYSLRADNGRIVWHYLTQVGG